MNDHLNMSSRAKADLFELLILVKLCGRYRLEVKPEYQAEIESLKEKIMEQPESKLRISEQYERAATLAPKLADFIDKENVLVAGKPKAVEWVGRQHRTTEGLEDLIIEFNSGSVGISLKSTRSGSGTQRNLGYANLKRLIGLDMDQDIEQMWDSIRAELKSHGDPYDKIALMNQTAIKALKRRHPLITRIGKRYGSVVQKKASRLSVELFNSLSDRSKNAFLKDIYGLNSSIPLINAIVDNSSTKIYWNFVHAQNNSKLKAVMDPKGLGYKIYCSGNAILRIQCSFTNSIGLSPFCERAFIVGG